MTEERPVLGPREQMTRAMVIQGSSPVALMTREKDFVRNNGEVYGSRNSIKSTQ